MARKKKLTQTRSEDRMIDMVDSLAEFQEFRDNVLPILRKDIAAGMTAEQLLAKYQSLATARTISIAATSENEGAALAAAKDVQDRAGGKAKERKEILHRLGELPEEEIDALLTSRFKETVLEDED